MARGRQGNGRSKGGGNTQTLRNYWTKGAGAAKIRWGTPGDWGRCNRELSKYMGARAKGYCQLRHMAATGMTTSAHAKALRAGRKR
jgi:hypothetical protein